MSTGFAIGLQCNVAREYYGMRPKQFDSAGEI